MGNRAKATKLKILQGNPGRRPINHDEPEPKAGIPTMPKWIKEFPVAVKEWKREAKILNEMGALTVAECGLLATRCYLASQIQEMASEIKKEGRVAYTSRMDSLGNEVMDAKANPKCIQIKNIITEYRQHGSLLGLDAPSRTKIKIDGKPRSKADKFKARKNGKP